MDARSVGLLIAVIGAAAVIVGLLLASGALGWFGRLPGDIRIETENVRIYVPITSMLLVSAALTIAVALARRFF
jgi:Protein of unknown function (DUF2905)